jgi:hypothetical protein
MKKRKPTKKTRQAHAERLERARRIDWNVMQEIVFRIERCQRCGAEPGPLHAVVHRLWVKEVKTLEAMLQIPSTEASS